MIGSSSNPSGTSVRHTSYPSAYVTERVSVEGSPFLNLEEVKQFLKVSHSLEDMTILTLIHTVIEDMEALGWMSLMASTYNVYTDRLYPNVPIMRGPVNTITHVKYYDDNNQQQTLDSSLYFVAKGTPTRLMPQVNVTWPSTYRRPDAVELRYTTSPSIDTRTKGRALQGVGYLFENRSNLEMRMTEIYRSILMGIRKNHF